jgi:hypothetical protein
MVETFSFAVAFFTFAVGPKTIDFFKISKNWGFYNTNVNTPREIVSFLEIETSDLPTNFVKIYYRVIH